MLSLLLRAIFGLTAIVTFSFGAIAAQPFDTTAFKQAQEAGKTVLIDITAPWCPTCRQQRPIVEQIEKEKPNLVVYEVEAGCKGILKMAELGGLALGYAAGALSALSPCVLPLLPIVLFGALEQHVWGPVALAAGLSASFAGIVYVDIWDGFVDEAGRYSQQGPDYEGQIRRLRTGDGVYFTKFGARKLAHYVEREIQRSTADRGVPVALPVPVDPGPQAPNAKPGGPAQRPLAGPVVPLTAVQAAPEELVGGGRAAPAVDATVSRVLTKGEPVAAPSGRADDFAWPRGSALNAQPAAADPASASLSSPASTRSSKPPSHVPCRTGWLP